MNSSDLTERPPVDPGHSSARNTSSPDSIQRASSQSDRPGSEPSSSSSRPKPSNQDQQYAFNEVTPIVSSSESAGRCYQSTDNPKNPDLVQGNGNPTEPTQGRRGNNGNQDPGSTSNNRPETPWYRRAADKFGTVELENKGSVARDHLALGVLIPSHLLFYSIANILCRTNIPRVAQNLVSFRIHWDSSNPALPLELLKGVVRRSCR